MKVSQGSVTIVSMLHVESWAPEYGAPIEHDPSLAPSESVIDSSVETTDWAPIAPNPSVADEFTSVWFVDGVRRVDARLTLDEPEGPIPGLCGSLGVGATHWDRTVPQSTFGEMRVERLAVIGSGRVAEIPTVGNLAYEPVSIAGDDPAELVRHFHNRMRTAEASLSAELASEGKFVIADGPINELKPQSVVGYIKTHRVNYLSVEETVTVRQLAPSQRTPMFLMDGHIYARYSWYLKLAEVPRGHTWSGVVRCEVPASLGLERAVNYADVVTVLLPQTAPPLHIDPRAPQNLVPIAAVERELRRRLGDPGLVYRALRQSIGAA